MKTTLVETLVEIMSTETWRDRFEAILRRQRDEIRATGCDTHVRAPKRRRRRKKARTYRECREDISDVPLLARGSRIGKGRWLAWKEHGPRPGARVGEVIVGDYFTWVEVDGVRARVVNFGEGSMECVRCVCGKYAAGRMGKEFCSRSCKERQRKRRQGVNAMVGRFGESIRCRDCRRPSKPTICARCQWSRDQVDEMRNALWALNKEIAK